MAYVKWGLVAIVFAVSALFLQYYLPSQDIVRIVGTDTVRVDVDYTDGQGNEQQRTRDQQRINTITPSGDERVYRNEDTGWGFPWYFKFDTANLQAMAEDAVSDRENPDWVVVRHYGWRIPVLSMFPNALSMRPASGPNESLIPWGNIVFVIALLIVALVIRRVLLIFRRRHVDPVVDEIDAGIDRKVAWWRRLFGGR